MISKLHKRIFVSAKNFSVFRSLYCNLKFLKTLKIRIFLGKKTTIIAANDCLRIPGKVYIDCRNTGQHFYYSSIVLNQGSKLLLADNVNFFSGAQIKCFNHALLSVGNDTYFSGPVTIHAKEKISIGSRCAISWGVTIIDSDFHPIGNSGTKTEAVDIGDDVWIGCNVTILKGAKIPSGSIIAAGALVNKSLSIAGIYAGNPAKFVRGVNE